MAMPTSQDEIEAYKRSRIEAYERQQAENAEILRQKKAADDAKRAATSGSAATSSASPSGVIPSARRMDRRAKAANRKTIDPAKIEEMKRIQQGQKGAVGGSGPATDMMLPPTYFPHTAPANSTEYSAGIMNCSDDSSLCCYFFCVCCFLAKSKAMADGRACDPFDICCIQPPCFIRKQMKAKFGIPQEECSDCFSMIFCCPCASCQDIIEMKRRYEEANITWNCSGTTMQSELYN